MVAAAVAAATAMAHLRHDESFVFIYFSLIVSGRPTAAVEQYYHAAVARVGGRVGGWAGGWMDGWMAERL